MNDFNIDQQFDFYLHKMQLDKSKMTETQLTETKRAFMGGMGQFMVAMMEMAFMSEGDSEKRMTSINEQLQNFWKSQK